jgi:hypothetical protein
MDEAMMREALCEQRTGSRMWNERNEGVPAEKKEKKKIEKKRKREEFAERDEQYIRGREDWANWRWTWGTSEGKRDWSEDEGQVNQGD